MAAIGTPFVWPYGYNMKGTERPSMNLEAFCSYEAMAATPKSKDECSGPCLKIIQKYL